MVVRKSLALSSLLLAVAGTVHAETLIKVDGSSTVYPISEAVGEEFQKARKNAVKVTIGISGTGGGFKKFCRGETDVSNASRPISKKEMEACAQAGIKYIELPVAYDAITVVVNNDNTWLKEVKVEELKAMWEPAAQGKIAKWSDVNPAWPDQPLALYGPGADSGTFDYFTDAINGKEKASRGDFTASEDDNVLVQGVSRNKGGLGYFGLAYYLENKSKLRAVPVVAKGASAGVAPGFDTVMDGSYQPLARPIFIYVSAKAAAEKPEVKEFVEFYLKNAPQLVKEVKYVPLSAADYTHGVNNFAKGKTGTAFGGTPEVGIKVAELLKRDPKE
ncbi:PstS family phosphate ABC transporter substrate-binding protein [Aromatoleum evansii]|uniref:PstS family phosphate ABC transporter substrate-binding protein n=1 Tax=Aromatoleum evansii TaxID=59406 RepID=UPI00145D0B4A|nr:PstS family phosphate ABC transporter substrate-binding protein [Aromatoleum evansii]NMG32094.1 phosphate ABC transporter substrate-binding protein PstS family protein [Aromatoleum evansii]